MDAPLLCNRVETTGTSPVLNSTRLEALGCDLVLYPLAATQATLVGTFEHLRRLKGNESGAIDELDDAVESLPVENLHDFAGFSIVVAWEERYIPETEERKYVGSAGVDIKDDE